jgi:hypothetical protein
MKLRAIRIIAALALGGGVALVGLGPRSALAKEAEAETTKAQSDAPAAASGPLFWCDSTDTGKLDLMMERQGDRYLMTNTAKYHPADQSRSWKRRPIVCTSSISMN